LASSGFDKRVVLWDLTANPPTSRALEGHTDDVWSVAFNLDGTQLASCDAGGQIRMWEASTGSAVGTPWLASGSNGAICSSLAFKPYGGRVAAGDHDGVVTLWDVWDVGLAKPIGRLARHTGPVTDVAFSPDDRVLVSSSLDGTVILWDVESDRQVGEPLRAHVGPVNAVAVSPDGKTLVSAGDDRRVMRWNIDLESWVAQACAIANRNLTEEEWQQYLPNIPYRETCPGAKLGQP
jgi:WD40 repeat protein